MKKLILLFFSTFTIGFLSAQTPSVNSDKKSKILIYITQGLENPTRAALGFLIAKQHWK